ncbi:MAG: hypothetical protein J1G02_01300 [Clostridiales bacterium]|nr:hypothetical protein [Clostridiales bacterium]
MMDKNIKLFAVICCALILLSVCFVFVGCKKEEPNYDVTLIVVCQEVKDTVGTPSGITLESWKVTPDTHYLDIERDYDGKGYTYFVYQYNMSDHPELSDVWFLNPRVKLVAGADVFVQSKYTKEVEHGKPSENYSYVSDRGVYTKEINVNALPGLNGRHLLLTITIR